MSQDRYDAIYSKVTQALEAQRLYLNADVSLSTLSRLLGTNTVYLSQAVNRRTGRSLTSLVNAYRLRFLITQAVETGEDIESLAQRYAFWSRSTLYDVFRRETGFTPHRYIRQLNDRRRLTEQTVQ